MEPKPNQPFDAATTVEHSSEGNRGLPPLVLSAERYRAIMEHLRLGLPNEGCGLIGGMRTPAGDRGVHFFPGTNIDHSPVRFTMEPKEVIDAMWWMRTLGWTLLAIVHSHPATKPVPSQTDLREWYYPEARLLIVSFASENPEARCWSYADDGETRAFRPVELKVIGR